MTQLILSNQYIKKQKLYEVITDKFLECGYLYNTNCFPIDAIELAFNVCICLDIEILNFDERKICGILYKAPENTSIALNKKRSSSGQNFDCMHELIHYWFHEDNSFYCDEDASSYFEWQANEGAAQFLMPYQMFIPLYKEIMTTHFAKNKYNNNYILKTVAELSRIFNVGEKVVAFRVTNLQSELEQYLNGTPIGEIKIVSHTERGKNLKYGRR